MMALFKKNTQLIEPYQDSYNCIDGEELVIEEIKILHYSDMGTQFSHQYAIARVKEEGFEHWFDGEIMPHPRQDLSEFFDVYYNEALANGYHLDNYRVEPFGDFPKNLNKATVVIKSLVRAFLNHYFLSHCFLSYLSASCFDKIIAGFFK